MKIDKRNTIQNGRFQKPGKALFSFVFGGCYAFWFYRVLLRSLVSLSEEVERITMTKDIQVKILNAGLLLFVVCSILIVLSVIFCGRNAVTKIFILVILLALNCLEVVNIMAKGTVSGITFIVLWSFGTYVVWFVLDLINRIRKKRSNE